MFLHQGGRASYPRHPICHNEKREVQRQRSESFINNNSDNRQIAVEWHQPSYEEGLRYQLQQKHEAEVGQDTGWSNIYSDKNDYFILPAISRGNYFLGQYIVESHLFS